MDDFGFQYVPEAELRKIVKEVKKDRQKRNEEKEWEECLIKKSKKLLQKQSYLKNAYSNDIVTDESAYGHLESNDASHCHSRKLSKDDRLANGAIATEDGLSADKCYDKLRIFNNSSLLCRCTQNHHCCNDNVSQNNHGSLNSQSNQRSRPSATCVADVNEYSRYYTNQNDHAHYNKCSSNIGNLQSGCDNVTSKQQIRTNKDASEVIHVRSGTSPCLPNLPDLPDTNLVWNDKFHKHNMINGDKKQLLAIKTVPCTPSNNPILELEELKVNTIRGIDFSNSSNKEDYGLVNRGLQPCPTKLPLVKEAVNDIIVVDQIVSNQVGYSDQAVPNVTDTRISLFNDDFLCNRQPKNQIIIDGELKGRTDKLKSKLMVILSKNLEALSNSGVNNDDDMDTDRKLKKANEFVSRFSRNYLYQLRRHFDAITKMNISNSNSQAFFQKLFICYQISLQALQTSQHFLPDTTRSSTDKLIEYLELLISILNIFDDHLDGITDSKDVINVCNELISGLKNNNTKLQLAQFTNSNMKVSSSVNKSMNKGTSLKSKQLNPHKKLAMYSAYMPGLPMNWKTTSTALAKKKFGNPKKKSSNVDKSCKKVEADKDKSDKFVTNKSDKRLPNDEDCFNCTFKNAGDDFRTANELPDKIIESHLKLMAPIRISTVIESFLNVDGDDLELPKDCNERTKLFLLCDRLSEMLYKDDSVENKRLKLTDPQKSDDIQISEDDMKNVFGQIQEMYLHAESLGLTRTSLDGRCSAAVQSRKKGHYKTIENGVVDKEKERVGRNVQYTCITFNENEFEQKHLDDNIVNPDFCSDDILKSAASFPLIELRIHEDEFESIVNYKNDFAKYVNSSPFYKNFDHHWSIVKRLSDKLLFSLISEVSEEFEVNSLIQKIYDLEFMEQVAV